MNKNQELKSIITEFVPIRANYCVIPLASAILSAGYVRLSDVELDEEKITTIIREFIQNTKANDHYASNFAHAIAQAKIVKVKE